MTTITVKIPEDLDRKITVLKASRKIGSKSTMIVKIVEEYFEKMDREQYEKLKKEVENWM